VVEELTKKGFLFKERFDESCYLNEVKKLFFVEPTMELMYLLPTLACNFACRYCYIEGNLRKKSNKKMSKEMAKRGIDLFIKNINRTEERRKQIIFYGGEPLLHYDLVKFAIEYIRQQEILCAFGKKGVNIILLTNGSLMTNEIAEFLKNFKVGVGLSVDGMKDVNDKMRQYPDGRGTFKDIQKGFEVLKKYSINPGISLTVGKHNINILLENIKFFEQEWGIRHITCNLSHPIQTKENPAELDSELAIKRIIECSSYLEEKGIHENRFMRRWESFIEKENCFNDCAGCGNQFVLLPDGYIGPCQGFSGSKKYYIPLRDDIDFRNEPIWKEWAKRSPFNMPECYDCNLISICGGGCPYASSTRHGSIWKIDEDKCHKHIFPILEFYIWKYYDRIKELKGKVTEEVRDEKEKPFSIPVVEWV
jgi:uncharacterized protein